MNNKLSSRSNIQTLIEDVLQSIQQVGSYGSVELFIQDNTVTQITVRQIRKTSSSTAGNGHKIKSTLDKPISIY